MSALTVQHPGQLQGKYTLCLRGRLYQRGNLWNLIMRKYLQLLISGLIDFMTFNFPEQSWCESNRKDFGHVNIIISLAPARPHMCLLSSSTAIPGAFRWSLLILMGMGPNQITLWFWVFWRAGARGLPGPKVLLEVKSCLKSVGWNVHICE